MISLGCSCVLHLLVLFSPVFGTIARFAPAGSQIDQKRPSSFSVTLTSSNIVSGQVEHHPVDSAVPTELSGLDPKPVTSAPRKLADSRMDATDLLPLPGIIYYPTSFLSVRPQPMAEANLDPPQIRPIVASGKIILTLWINPFGATSKVAVEATDLPQPFVGAAVAAFEQLRFKPGELHGQKVGSVMKIEVTYDDGRLLKTEVVP